MTSAFGMETDFLTDPVKVQVVINITDCRECTAWIWQRFHNIISASSPSRVIIAVYMILDVRRRGFYFTMQL